MMKKENRPRDNVCARLQIDQQNASLDFQEAVNAVKKCLQSILTSKISFIKKHFS